MNRRRRATNLRARLVHEARIHYSFLRVVLPQFKISVSVFLVMNLVGGLIIWTEYPGLSFPHALYTALALNFFEVQEAYPSGGSLLLQACFFLLPAVGLTVIAEGVLRLGVAIFNRKQLAKEWHMALAATYRDHVVIAGLGRIGRRVMTRLQRNEHLACIELRKKPETSALSDEVALIIGDATLPDVLTKANVAQARAILALTDNDLANLEIALNARELNPEIRVVLRMFNEKLGRKLVEQFQFEAVYSTSSLAAPSFSAALYSDKILQTIDVGDDETVHMARLKVNPGSPLVGRSILDVERDASVSVILHYSAGSKELLPAVDACVSEKDELFVLAELDSIERVDRLARGA